jgi:AraC-like DNA-binding protein
MKVDAPCDEQWQWHLQTGRRTHAVQSHVCPLGLRCSCVPIFYGETLVGTAKVVAGPATKDRRFTLAAQALELAVSSACHDLHVSALSEQLENLRAQVAQFQDVRRSERVAPDGGDATSERRDGSLIDQALGYLGAHYLDPALSLAEVSRELGVNSKYLTRLFTRVVGQRMHAYILDLRVQHTCRLLLSTDRPIKQIALESGFRRPDGFRRAFQEHVGVAPAVYRRIFTAA